MRKLSDTTGIAVDVPQMDVTTLVAQASQDFERNQPSADRIFASINGSISAFNTTLELGNVTHFKGFSQGKDGMTLEDTFSGDMADFAKHMAIMNNVKLYETFKKMIEEFKKSMKAGDEQVYKSLYSAALAEGYGLQGVRYSKTANDGVSNQTYAFTSYRMADVDGIMNRSMTEAGLDMKTLTDGAKIVDLLENKSALDVKLFFEVQTMALEQAFKLAAGDGKCASGGSFLSRDSNCKKGYYREYSGDRALWKGFGGDLIEAFYYISANFVL